ncbi:GMC oxidoreductase [Aaosphaeria arxii CBS 175.79]|uniref:GMC oxidoreductase n=1 Tax=Aaosphaeria arxii CBS 175.79 TaxID=1450172 RepID=A0A6A5XRI8_9PLEO|nr:GMC oxidoreductase [Aaosphaeria arxii CBS 175.79]KAF2015792.1 GMC oxidoreductase [Aaosphaeria arxii CBS 175.79]
MARLLLLAQATVALLSTPTLAHIPRGVNIKRHITELESHYDYIIAGGGTSGLTVADRLTAAFPSRSVLVVEYGQLVNDTAILQPAATVPNPRYAFQILSQKEPGLNNRSFTVTVGKIVGGCSAINAQMFDRGSAADYDAWGDVAGEGYREAGWSWAGLLPYFKKSTTFTPPTKDVAEKYDYTYDMDAAWGGDGGIQAVYPPFQWPGEKIIRHAWNELGVPTQKEGSGGDAFGVIWFPSSQDAQTQTRSYARTGHYDNVANRSNYHLLVGHAVNDLVLAEASSGEEQWEARGVRIQAVDGKNASVITITSDQEVILAAGAVHTPGILQRSGIGPKDVLGAANIPVRLELPGVGQNFQDHAMTNLFYNLTTNIEPNQMSLFMNRTLMEQARREYAQNKTGPFTLSGGNSGAFLPLSTLSNNSQAIINALKAQSPSSYLSNTTHPTVLEGYSHQLEAMKDLLSSNEAAVFEYPIGAGAMVAFLKPLSRGTVNINPANPTAEPLVSYRTFTNPLDVKLYTEGVKIFRRLYTTPSAKTLGPVELTPGAAVQTDAEWETWLKRSVSPSFYHPVGTTALGPKSRGGVVGPELKVHGVGNLRVVDAGIMPLIPGTHTSSTVYAVAEKAADLIVKDGRD